MQYHSAEHAQAMAALAQTDDIVEEDDQLAILDEFMEASREASLPALDALFFAGQIDTIGRQDKAFSEAVKRDLSSPLEALEKIE